MDNDLPVPLNDWVLVTPHRMPEKTEAGIIIPDSARKSMNHGSVMAVGPGKPVDGLAMELFFPREGLTSPHLSSREPRNEALLKAWPRRPMAVAVGDVVHFLDRSAEFIEASDGIYAMMKEEDILAIE